MEIKKIIYHTLCLSHNHHTSFSPNFAVTMHSICRELQLLYYMPVFM